jgi:hypothetical protein
VNAFSNGNSSPPRALGSAERTRSVAYIQRSQKFRISAAPPYLSDLSYPFCENRGTPTHPAELLLQSGALGWLSGKRAGIARSWGLCVDFSGGICACRNPVGRKVRYGELAADRFKDFWGD